MSLKDHILAIQDHSVKEIDVPIWGKVHIRTLTAAERNEIETKALDKTIKWDFRVSLVGLCLCEPDGTQCFQRNEFDKIAKKAATPVDCVFDECLKLNHIGKHEAEAIEKKLEDHTGNDSSPTYAVL